MTAIQNNRSSNPLANGHVAIRQIWPSKTLLGDQRELGEERFVDRLEAVDHQRHGAQCGENGSGAELDLADAEPRIVGAAPVRLGEREAVGHVATVPAAAPVV